MQAFNKADVLRPDFAFKWMRDLDALQDALDATDTYAATLGRSLALVLEEFYEHLHHVAVSTVTGEGMADLHAVRLPVPPAAVDPAHASLVQCMRMHAVGAAARGACCVLGRTQSGSRRSGRQASVY